MDDGRLERLKARMKAAGLAPRGRWGQNFLLDANLVRHIAQLGEPGAGDLVLEVGCGTGFLTAELAADGAEVLAVDIDRPILALAQEETSGRPVEYLAADILAGKHGINPEVEAALAARLAARPELRLKAISNLPYSAGTPFVANLLSSPLPWVRGVFLLQLEVVERLAATPGSPEYGSLAIVAGLGGSVRLHRRVPPEVFWPRPKVTSAIAVVDFAPPAARAALPWEALRAVTQAIFSARRKTLRNALRRLFGERTEESLAAAGLDGSCRGETLPPADFLALARLLPAHGSEAEAMDEAPTEPA